MQDAKFAILSKLEEVFAPFDAEVLKATKLWAEGRVAALNEFKNSEEYEVIKRNSWALYPRLFAIAGSKTWYQVFKGTASDIEAFVERNHKETILKRNASIAKKLAKAGVSEVVDNEFTRTVDGFNGVFVVNTDSGRKTVTINTIYAGGYNIQCLHLRVLVKVK